MQRATGAPLDLSPGTPPTPGGLERWKLPLTAVLLVATVVGAAWWLTRRPVEQPIAIPTPGAAGTRSVKVDVIGAVARPGLYTLDGESRIDDAIREAGGALAGADLTRLNRAQRLRDGQQVVVPVQSIVPAAGSSAAPTAVSSAPPSPAVVGAPIPATRNVRATRPAGPPAGTKLNLNRASAADLEALPGIGAATAKRILEYRDKNGPFQSTDDLRKARLVTTRIWDQVKDLMDAP